LPEARVMRALNLIADRPLVIMQAPGKIVIGF
jgi:hypothetical protein